MPSESHTVGTCADATGVGTKSWSNPTNAQGACDTTVATVTLNTGESSHYLKGTNLDFAIPAGAVIDGITVVLRRKCSNLAGDIKGAATKIVKGGTIGGTDHSTGSSWPTTLQDETFGSASDKWGQTWTTTDINSSDFGVAASCVSNSEFSRTGSIDCYTITVNYHFLTTHIMSSQLISLLFIAALTLIKAKIIAAISAHSKPCGCRR